jgi:hypothetical protein
MPKGTASADKILSGLISVVGSRNVGKFFSLFLLYIFVFFAVEKIRVYPCLPRRSIAKAGGKNYFSRKLAFPAFYWEITKK